MQYSFLYLQVLGQLPQFLGLNSIVILKHQKEHSVCGPKQCVSKFDALSTACSTNATKKADTTFTVLYSVSVIAVQTTTTWYLTEVPIFERSCASTVVWVSNTDAIQFSLEKLKIEGTYQTK